MTKKMTISIIAAVSENGVIGSKNKLPWHLPADLKHFKDLTIGHHVIMGRKTYESVGKPLPNRTTIIITRQSDFLADGCIIVNSLEAAIHAVRNDKEPFICGGAEIYKTALKIAGKMYLTKIHKDFEGDAFFPEIDLMQWEETGNQLFTAESNALSQKQGTQFDYSFCVFEKKQRSS